jgi:hypothetical protein
MLWYVFTSLWSPEPDILKVPLRFLRRGFSELAGVKQTNFHPVHEALAGNFGMISFAMLVGYVCPEWGVTPRLCIKQLGMGVVLAHFVLVGMRLSPFDRCLRLRGLFNDIDDASGGVLLLVVVLMVFYKRIWRGRRVNRAFVERLINVGLDVVFLIEAGDSYASSNSILFFQLFYTLYFNLTIEEATAFLFQSQDDEEAFNETFGRYWDGLQIVLTLVMGLLSQSFLGFLKLAIANFFTSDIGEDILKWLDAPPKESAATKALDKSSKKSS